MRYLLTTVLAALLILCRFRVALALLVLLLMYGPALAFLLHLI